jgi:hypothetical protein
MSMLQKAQNRMLRTITRTWLRDKVRIGDLLNRTGLLSVNQTAAQIKLCEMWKAVKQRNYPIKLEKATQHTNGRAARHSEDI